MAINSYHSQYPKEYYEKGEVYSFYFSKADFPATREATRAEISEFSKKLLNLESPLFDDGNNPAFGRSYGVVIDIRKEEKLTVLYVMFVTNEALSKFIVKKYAIEYKEIITNDKEWYEPGLVTTSTNKVTPSTFVPTIGQPVPVGKTGQPEPVGKTGQPVPTGKTGQPIPEK